MGRPAKTNEQRMREQVATVIRALVEAEIEESWVGAAPTVGDQRLIEAETKEARMNMRELLDQLYPGSTRAIGQDY